MQCAILDRTIVTVSLVVEAESCSRSQRLQNTHFEIRLQLLCLTSSVAQSTFHKARSQNEHLLLGNSNFWICGRGGSAEQQKELMALTTKQHSLTTTKLPQPNQNLKFSKCQVKTQSDTWPLSYVHQSEQVCSTNASQQGLSRQVIRVSDFAQHAEQLSECFDLHGDVINWILIYWKVVV